MNWWEIVIQIVSIVLGSVGLFSFIEFMIKRRDEQHSLLKEISKKMDKMEKDNCRTQMLVLMSEYPEEQKELMTIAEHYFHDLHGNWYMTALFRKHLRDSNITPPVWFRDAFNNSNAAETGGDI